ncbi:uncharacterized protein [Clytia hemisphaerica]|uniref:uncharacterized protein n=1 Tax=Clytia hemisphaerica TaxID=252671 RepID=UPI0034D5C9C9
MASLQYVVLLLVAFNLALACQNNARLIRANEWRQGSLWTTNGVVVPTFSYELKDWSLKLVFYNPLATHLTTWITTGQSSTQGKMEVILYGDFNHQILTVNRDVSYFARFTKKQSNTPRGHLQCAQFCGKIKGTNTEICDGSAPAPVTQAPSTGEGVCSSTYNYNKVLKKSLLFYEAQRSGKLPADQRVKWRHDSTMTDGSDVGLDLTGGYFDAGDYVKFGFPMTATITNLAWGMLEFKKGYTLSGQYEYGLKAIKWGTDYFIKCHPEPNKLYGQVGNGKADHGYWGRPEDMRIKRPSFYIDKSKPGSDLAGETAAALAASALVFEQKGDTGYSNKLKNHAKQLYNFAMTYRKKYSDSIPDAANFYRSWSGYRDELAWASLWMFRATGDATYKNIFLKEFDNDAFSQSPGQFSWDNKWHGVQVLAQQLKISNKNYLGKLKSTIQSKPRSPKGMIYIQKWGTLRHAANLAFLARVASTMADGKFYNKFALSQINYMLGDAGRSYVVGFGNNPPKRPHHRSSSCPVNGPCGWPQEGAPGPNPQILHGALVGGPDNNDNYADNRGDYVKNEVACDYNAGFQSAIAGLIQLKNEECG